MGNYSHFVNVVYATYSISKWLIIIILGVCIAPLCSVHCAHAFKCPNVNFISTLHDFQGKARKKNRRGVPFVLMEI